MNIIGLRGKLLCIAVGVVSTVAFAAPAQAAPAQAQGRPDSASANQPSALPASFESLAAQGMVRTNPVDSAGPQVCAESPKGEVTCVWINPDGSLGAGLPAEVMASGRSGTEWTVGVGWNIYLYLNRNDIHWLIGLGYAGASAAICAMLVETIIGAVICAGLAYVVWEAINNYAYLVDPGECLELKFGYTGAFKGARVVARNC